MDLDRFGRSVGYVFSDRDLLVRALTHRSFGAAHNERLEFLGDSVVNCAVALELYRKFPNLTEGELSRLRDKGHVGSRADFDATVPMLAGFTKKVGFVF